MKSFPYSPDSPPLIFSIKFLIPYQSSVYFSNTFLFLSVELKTKYLFPFFSAMEPSTSPKSEMKGLHNEHSHNQNFSL